jgi:indole-3-glycerol phosphate synthase
VLTRDYDPAAIARRYEAGGAAAVSVLTEPTFFDGSLAHLEAVRAAVSIPVLRKDFTVDEYQLVEARAAGADAVLLIVAALPQDRLEALLARAFDLGLAPLVEVHTAEELSRAAGAGARLIGVNSRNLKTLDVVGDTFLGLLDRMPSGAIAVAESGLGSDEDVRRLHAAGYPAFLIGEWLMRSDDPASRVHALTGGPR